MADKSKERYSISVPKFSLKNNSYTPLLMALLLVASFFLGRLTNQVESLQKGTTVGGTPTAGAEIPGAPPALTVDNVKPVSDDDHIRGNKDAKVTIIEYSDLECPFCKSFHPTVNDILQTYGNDVRLVYRHFPLGNIHPSAQKAAEASECVAELGGNDKFWEYVDKIFASATPVTITSLSPFAVEIGINQTQFQSCLDSGKYAQKVADQYAEGTSAGVNGTPTSFIIDQDGKGEAIVGAQPKESLTTIIDQLLN